LDTFPILLLPRTLRVVAWVARFFEAAEAWALARGYSMMQLYVLPENSGARKLYERAEYRPEWIKYVRPLR
jgi:GNAT superfamily N-acetyltransferase